jgi:hypothetical protein
MPEAFWNLPVPPLIFAEPVELVEPSDAIVKVFPDNENCMESPLPNVMYSSPLRSAVDRLVALSEPASMKLAFPIGVAGPNAKASKSRLIGDVCTDPPVPVTLNEKEVLEAKAGTHTRIPARSRPTTGTGNPISTSQDVSTDYGDKECQSQSLWNEFL